MHFYKRNVYCCGKLFLALRKELSSIQNEILRFFKGVKYIAIAKVDTAVSTELASLQTTPPQGAYFLGHDWFEGLDIFLRVNIIIIFRDVIDHNPYITASYGFELAAQKMIKADYQAWTV